MAPTVPRPEYVYVASSWRNPAQPAVVEALRAAEIDCYDFRHPEPGNEGFSWRQVGSDVGDHGPGITPKGQDLVDVETYRRMLDHPVAVAGFELDFAAMERADAFVLVLPCGRSAHLELGWAVGAGKRTAILLEDPAEPELMYRMVDLLASSVEEVLQWFGVPMVETDDGLVRDVLAGTPWVSPTWTTAGICRCGGPLPAKVGWHNPYETWAHVVCAACGWEFVDEDDYLAVYDLEALERLGHDADHHVTCTILTEAQAAAAIEAYNAMGSR